MRAAYSCARGIQESRSQYPPSAVPADGRSHLEPRPPGSGSDQVMAPTGSREVRERLVEALELDLVGPWHNHPLAEERLPGWTRPSNWYLTGFLIPAGTSPEKA